MANIYPHLLFPGNTLEAFEFYRKVFGGAFSQIRYFKDLPQETPGVTDANAEKILQISLPIGAHGMLTGSDMAAQYQPADLITGNRYTLSLTTSSADEADYLYQSLSAGGTIEIPLEKSPWGSYFAMFADQYGIQWMIAFEG